MSPPSDNNDREEGLKFQPKYDAVGPRDLRRYRRCERRGADGRAYERRGAAAEQSRVANVWYFSRSRNALWRKGETSGHTQRVAEMRIDCDQDAVWIRVEQTGAAPCHTGRRSCFYRAVKGGEDGAALSFVDAN